METIPVSCWTRRSNIDRAPARLPYGRPERASGSLAGGLAALLCLAGHGIAQAPPAQRIDISVEHQDGGSWKAVPPGFVFNKGEHVRFRVRANFDGYLYVMDYGTSGQYTNLFPRDETGTDNRIKSGVEYFVPATDASFRVDGPPGYDAVYWVMSPIALGNGAGKPYVPLPPPPPNPVPQNLTPRCDDAVLHARGLCIDSSAGPKNIAPDEKLPESLQSIPHAQSRDLLIFSQTQSTSVSSPERMEGPVLYKFLVAHQ